MLYQLTPPEAGGRNEIVEMLHQFFQTQCPLPMDKPFVTPLLGNKSFTIAVSG
jgi:hypothetical protein